MNANLPDAELGDQLASNFDELERIAGELVSAVIAECGAADDEARRDQAQRWRADRALMRLVDVHRMSQARDDVWITIGPDGRAKLLGLVYLPASFGLTRYGYRPGSTGVALAVKRLAVRLHDEVGAAVAGDVHAAAKYGNLLLDAEPKRDADRGYLLMAVGCAHRQPGGCRSAWRCTIPRWVGNVPLGLRNFRTEAGQFELVFAVKADSVKIE